VQKIIDAHVHLSERRDDALRGFAKLNGLTYTLDELVDSMRKHQVERGSCSAHP